MDYHNSNANCARSRDIEKTCMHAFAIFPFSIQQGLILVPIIPFMCI